MNKSNFLHQQISKVYGVGPAYVKRLKKLGVSTVRDLLYYYPKKHEDLTKVKNIADLKESDKEQTVRVKLLEIENVRTRRKRMFLTKAIFEDQGGEVNAVWFNQPYLSRTFKEDQFYLLSGKIKRDYNGFVFQNPKYELVKGEQVHAGRIVPVYRETEGLSSKWLRHKIKLVLGAADEVKEFLPESIIKSQKFYEVGRALKQIHFPESQTTLKEAKKRLSFEELFLVQLVALGNKKKWEEKQAVGIKFDQKLAKDFVQSLPFKLTKAQKVTAWEILKNLQKTTPMNRLLEGDVGSGKTVVAAMAILMVVQNKYQVSMMVPTEILAKQHFRSLSELLKKHKIKVGLLTSKEVLDNGGKKISKKDLIKKVKEGKIDLLIGTHALIEKEIGFKNLGLVIIDEQHRFGVEQRAVLHSKAKKFPHFLSMTATPIPRTLALSMFGDLDLSIIDELPKGRKKILTKVVSSEKRNDAYKFVDDKVKEGRQVFVICPLIEKSDKLGVKSATQEYQKLSREIFPDLKIGLLHGRLSAKGGPASGGKKDEKAKIMDQFRDGKLDILVSTSVVEVGVDIPNATIMMIEGAERFGLAQLHQFRGRVGRSEYQSYCFLFPTSLDSISMPRLKALEKNNDGFKLAEIDLEHRGPGEVYGKSQSGYFYDFKLANPTDVVMTQQARKEAEKILKEDPGLKKYNLLKKKVSSVEVLMHRE
ncbi:ATP-dependent DNA helicase RecG [Patescibacteria group bacterium]